MIRQAVKFKTVQKVAFYYRIAGSRSSNSKEIRFQQDRVRAFAVKQGYSIYKEYCDEGYSGTNFDRPGFAKMEADMGEGKFDTIIVSSVDRIARDMFIREGWLRQLKMMGVRIVALDGSHEMPTFLFQNPMATQELMHGKKT